MIRVPLLFYRNSIPPLPSVFHRQKSAGRSYTNILVNGDFESGFTTGIADGWSKLGGGQTFTEETTTVHTAGGSAQKITCVNDGQHMGIRQAVTLTSGLTYQVGCWIYLNSERITQIDCANLGAGSANDTIPATTWTQLIWEAVATATGAVNLDIRQSVPNCTPADYLILDDCWLYQL
jgi:hypothetical protein